MAHSTICVEASAAKPKAAKMAARQTIGPALGPMTMRCAMRAPQKRRSAGRDEPKLAKKAEAEKAGNAAVANRYQSEADKHQKKVDEKRLAADEEEKKLEPFILAAPADGTVETTLAQGDSFKPEDVVFSVKGTPPLRATFTIKGQPYAADAEVEIVAKADDKKRLDCKVIQVEGDSVSIECSEGGGLNAGDEVILRP